MASFMAPDLQALLQKFYHHNPPQLGLFNSSQQQLQTLYALQLCLLQHQPQPQFLPLWACKSMKLEQVASPESDIQGSSPKPDQATRSPTSFSIDDLLRQHSPSTSVKTSADCPTDPLSIADGRCKRRQTTPESVDGSRHVCGECGKSYATSSNLSRHKQTHRPMDSPHAKPCPDCGRVYVSMPALSMHILTHKANHQCQMCGKMFSRMWLLKNHMRSHTGQKPYRCSNCSKAFADRSNLRAHMHTHTGEKKHQCENCHKKFSLKSYLNKHLEQVCLRKKVTKSALQNDDIPMALDSDEDKHCTHMSMMDMSMME